MFGSASEVVARLLISEPTLGVQLTETVLIACVFGLAIPASTRYCSRVFKSRPWYPHTAAIMRDQVEKMLGISMSEAMLDKQMGNIMPIMGQHLLGGCLCLPAIFGLGVPRHVALAMARHGALTELGWEIQDTVERLYERFFTEQGPALQPNAMFFFMLMHHSMQWSLVIPMNLYYSELSGYHELVFLLEGASAAAGLIGFYGYTLDATKRPELLQMVILNAIGLAIMVYARFVHYWWSVFKCLSHFYTEGSYVVLLVGIVCGVFAMPYIAISFVPQQWTKLLKFARMYMASCDQGVMQVPSELPALLTTNRHPNADASACAKEHME